MILNNLEIEIYHVHAHKHMCLIKKYISPSKPSFRIDFDSTTSSEKENFSSSTHIVCNYCPTSSFYSQIESHHNEETSTESTNFNLTYETEDILPSS